jgi:DegV family protein with EDD domain
MGESLADSEVKNPGGIMSTSSTASIAVVTDSAAGIPDDLLKRHNITVVPYWVHMGDESFVSGQTMHPPEFFRRLRAAPELEVHTGVPAVAKFTEAYRSLATWAKGIVSVHVAGKQSATYDAAQIAARDATVPIIVVDTQTTAMAEGFVVLAAARKAAVGATLQQVVDAARDAVPHVGLFALLESVSYALKGGRLSSAAGRVGSLLNIQPLIRVDANKVSLMGQARRRSQGIKALIERTVNVAKDEPIRLTVHYAEDEAEGRGLLDALTARLNVVESYLTRVPVELGVHSGPGAIGVAYYVEHEASGLMHQLEQQITRLGDQAKEAIRSRLP